MSYKLTEMKVDIVGCARCQADHKELLFRPFSHPPEGFTHWADCPTNGEPILMVVTSDNEGQDRK